MTDTTKEATNKEHTQGEWKYANESTQNCYYVFKMENSNLSTYQQIATGLSLDDAKFICDMKHSHERLVKSNKDLVAALQNFCDNVIPDKKIYDNQISYFKARFKDVIEKNSL